MNLFNLFIDNRCILFNDMNCFVQKSETLDPIFLPKLAIEGVYLRKSQYVSRQGSAHATVDKGRGLGTPFSLFVTKR